VNRFRTAKYANDQSRQPSLDTHSESAEPSQVAVGEGGGRVFEPYALCPRVPERARRAHYANGVLEVHVQKPEQSKPRRVPVMTTVEGGSTD
jgi:hypothetical protein